MLDGRGAKFPQMEAYIASLLGKALKRGEMRGLLPLIAMDWSTLSLLKQASFGGGSLKPYIAPLIS